MGMQFPKKVTVSGQVVKGAGHLGSVLITPGSTETTLVLYDNEAASGTELFNGKLAANGDTKQFVYVPGMRFTTGIYASITGTGAVAIVGYY